MDIEYGYVPRVGDLMERRNKSIVSLIAVLAVAILFAETQQFFTPHLITDLQFGQDKRVHQN
jgi:hypothetical protein